MYLQLQSKADSKWQVLANLFDFNYCLKNKIILFRVEEENAAYSKKNSKTLSILEALVDNLVGFPIVVLVRYDSQKQNLSKKFGKKIKILKMSFDGKILLQNCHIFIGSGGTMTAESAFLGIPTISFNAVPNLVEKYLVKKKLIIRESNPKKIAKATKKILISNDFDENKAKKILQTMEDPSQKLENLLKNLKNIKNTWLWQFPSK